VPARQEISSTLRTSKIALTDT